MDKEKPKLKIAKCSHAAAKYAVDRWHYSESMPTGKLVKYGVWENDKFIGVVIYGRGANKSLGSCFGLMQTEVCELVRIALTEHEAPVTKIVAITLRLLKKGNPGIVLVVSYADETNQNHKGTIYKAGNWEYLGLSTDVGYIVDGKPMHRRSLNAKWGTVAECRKQHTVEQTCKQVKHKFIYKLRDKQAMDSPTITAAGQHRPSRSIQ
ncbi:MAG: Mom family adenine methylcarbamoylation protein [Candidatus Anammoxibacter sp.]